MSKPLIISGEASETDSEEEVLVHNMTNVNLMTSSVKGKAITGEDSESENEGVSNDASPSSGQARTSNVKSSHPDSLLHMKLKESNNELYNDLNTFIKGAVNEGVKTLMTIDQNILKTQLTVQNAVTSLKHLSSNSLSLKNKLNLLLSSKFIPNIKTNQ